MTTDEGGDVGSLNQDWLGLFVVNRQPLLKHRSACADVLRSDQIRSLSSHLVGGADLIQQARRETRGTSLGLYIIAYGFFFQTTAFREAVQGGLFWNSRAVSK